LVTPEDEHELATGGWADEVFSFKAGPLDELCSVPEAVRNTLHKAIDRLGVKAGHIACESGSAFEPASYAASHLYGSSLSQLLSELIPAASVSSADEILSRLRSVKTPREVERIRLACRVARQAFEFGAEFLHVGLRETEVAHLFEGPLTSFGLSFPGVARCGGFVYCMSGVHSAQAAAAYARTRAREVERGDLVLVHCNSYVDGFWTDITRTYAVETTDGRQQRMYQAVLAARAAALDAIRPGVQAADVDRVARTVIADHGFAAEFKHATGHGVGFAAIDHNAQPRLHPCSAERLETGMVCNVEPAIYIDGFGGLRHCDVVAVTATGVEVLTPFQAHLRQLVVQDGGSQPRTRQRHGRGGKG
jgi:Xaa-Pro aminopeptidase